MLNKLALLNKRALAANKALLVSPTRFFRASQAMNKNFNVYIDGKPVSVSSSMISSFKGRRIIHNNSSMF